MATSSATQQRVEAIVGPALAHAGFELVEVSFASGQQILRLTIDHLDPADATSPPPSSGDDQNPVAGDGEASASQSGISLEHCARASKVADAALEASGDGLATGHDSLEVSSPGVKRPLTKPAHFARFVGQPVQLQLRPEAVAYVAGSRTKQRRLRARLVAADAEGISLAYPSADEQAQASQPERLSYAQLDRANLVYEQISPTTELRNRGPRARARAKE